MLKNLQCNVLKPHGRDHAVHIFLQFTGNPAQVSKTWIQQYVADPRHLTSAGEQLEQIRIFHHDHVPGGMIGGVFLSAEGYRYLGFDADVFDDENQTFRHGMKHHDFDLVQGLLDTANKDPLPETWEQGYQETIHAMLLLADDTLGNLQAEAAQISASVNGIATVVAAEYGNVLRNGQSEAAGVQVSRSLGAVNSQPEVATRALTGEPEPVGAADATPPKERHIEHFGYVDGRSLPAFLVEDFDEEKGLGGPITRDPSAPLSLALVPDPLATEEDSFGSYFVFRKLEQNVAGFNAGVRALADTLGIDPNLAEPWLLGGSKMGRR